MQNKMMVVGYARVSTDNQLENYSIEEQTERLKSYCAAKDWILVQTYVDGGYSGGNTDRPALQQMLAEIHKGKIDAVVVYKLDRLSRSQKDTLTLIEDELLSHGTDFVSINENFDTSTPFGRAMIGILSVFAQLEKDQITERFTMGRIGRSKAGYFHGGGNAPTGYDYIDGELVINEYEAQQVRKVFNMFLAGSSINAIHRGLEKAYTTKWSAAKVRNVLKNSVYIGKVKFMKEEHQGAHEPIIEETIFRAANALLSSSARNEKTTSYPKTPFRAEYLLSGLVYCSRCGAKYSANHGYYKCYSRAKSTPKFIVDPNCKNDNWEISILDNLIVGQIDLLSTSKDSLEELKHDSKKTNKIEVDRSRVNKRISEIDKQIGKLIELYQVSSIPMASISEKVEALSHEKSSLSQQLENSNVIPQSDLFEDALSDYVDGFKESKIEQQRLMISRLIEKILIDGKSIKIQWRL